MAKEQVDPIYEVAGIQVALEEGPAILFENIKGYPGVGSGLGIDATVPFMENGATREPITYLTW